MRQKKRLGMKMMSFWLTLAMLITFVPKMALTVRGDVGETVSLTALSGTSGTYNQGYEKLVNGTATDNNDKWCVDISSQPYIIFRADNKVAMTGYILTTGGDTAEISSGGRNWKNWTIYGANFENDNDATRDSAAWTVVTSVENDSKLGAFNYQPYEYTVNSAGYYKYYRIEVTASKGEQLIQMSEFTMKGRPEPTEYSYLDAVWDPDQKTVVYTPKTTQGAVTRVTASQTTWTSGWYVVDYDVTTSNRYTVKGDVKLILCNGKTLNTSAGISIDNATGYSLTIYGQSNDGSEMGSLYARYQSTTADARAGIGGSGKGKKAGKITINGGKIYTSGSREAGGAGIGGGFQASGTNTTINGGVITIPARKSVAGIGGGREGASGNITINGGTINSNGYAGSAIGSSYHGTTNTITINGGTINATNSTKGAAIGSGEGNGSKTSAGTIIINGGTITAKNTAGSGSGAAAIGGGYGVNGGTVKITGGTVFAQSTYGAGIGGGPKANGGNVTITGGMVTAYSSNGGVGIGAGSGKSSHGSLSIPNTHVSRAGNSPTSEGSCFNYPSHRKKYVNIWEHSHSDTIEYGIRKDDGTVPDDGIGNVLYAKCSNTSDGVHPCNMDDGEITLTLNAPDKLYDGVQYNRANTVWTSVEHNHWEEISSISGKSLATGGGVIEYYEKNTETDVLTKLGGAPTNAGTYVAKLPFMEGSETKYLEKEFEIIPLQAYFKTAPTVLSLTYNGNEQELITKGEAQNGAPEFKLDDDTAWSADVPKKTNAGTYTVWCQVEGDGVNVHSSKEFSLDVTIKKKPAPVLTDNQKPTANSEAPSGDDPDSETPLLKPPTDSLPEGYKMYYAIGEDGEGDNDPLPETGWSEEIPEGKDGTYIIWFKAVKDDNHEETTPKKIEVVRIDYNMTLEPDMPTVGVPVVASVSPADEYISYEWYVGSSAQSIVNITGNTYTPTDADKGKTLKVVAKLNGNSICENVTEWPVVETAPEPGKQIISGKVYTSDGTSGVDGATVKLMRGNDAIATTTTDTDGRYIFIAESGTYNLVAVKGEVTKTELVELDTDITYDLFMPDGKTNSVLTVKENTPAVMVGGLDQEAEAVRAGVPNAASTVTVTMTVEEKAESSAANAADIRAIASGKKLEFLDISIVKNINGTETPINTTTNLMEIVVPFDFSGKRNVTAYRYHGTEAKELGKVDTDSETTPTEGSFRSNTDEQILTIYARDFSTYAIGYNVNSGGGGYTPPTIPEPVITQPEHGTITINPEKPKANDPVVITVLPEDGYETESITVTDKDGKTIEVTRKEDGTYTYINPSGGGTRISANVVSVNYVKVSFDLNGKEGIVPDAQVIKKGEKAVRPTPDPVAEGYTFSGWFTDEKCTKACDFDTAVEEDIILYAGWENKDFGIYFVEQYDDPYEGIHYNSDKERYEIAYTGSAISPLIKATSAADGTLVEGVDYTVSYSGNRNVSEKPAVITVTGKGTFAKKKTLEFYIIPADLNTLKEEGRMVVADEYGVQSGKKFTPVLVYGAYQLKAKDYTLSVTDKITTDIKVSITGKGNFTGTIEDISVKVLTPADVKANAIKVDVKAEKKTYNGVPKELSVSTAEKPGELTVSAGSSKTPLEEDTDFVVAYSGNINAGTASVVVTGIGNYNGTVRKTFKIEPDKVSEITAGLTDPEDHVYYNVRGAMPGVTVTASEKDKSGAVTGSHELTSGKDYKVTYSKNNKVGTGSYTIRFYGNYKGHKDVTGTFTIEKAPMDEAIVVSPQLIYKKPGKYLSAPFVSVDGVQLKASEYTAKYYEGDVTDVTAEGVKELTSKDKLSLGEGETSKTVTVVVIAKDNNFTGSARGTYEVVKPAANAIDLSKAKIVAAGKDAKGKDVSVGKQEYTGEAIEPEIRVLVRQDKQWKEVDSSAYSVTYINNVNKGKAVILINGDGEKTVGNKKVNFTITTMKMSLFKLIFGE